MGEYYTEEKSKNHLKHVKTAWDKLSSHLNKKLKRSKAQKKNA